MDICAGHNSLTARIFLLWNSLRDAFFITQDHLEWWRKFPVDLVTGKKITEEWYRCLLICGHKHIFNSTTDFLFLEELKEIELKERWENEWRKVSLVWYLYLDSHSNLGLALWVSLSRSRNDNFLSSVSLSRPQSSSFKNTFTEISLLPVNLALNCHCNHCYIHNQYEVINNTFQGNNIVNLFICGSHKYAKTWLCLKNIAYEELYIPQYFWQA